MYTYSSGNLSPIQRTNGSKAQTYGFTYDSMGNIATYAAPGKGTVTYTYDNQGQLLKAAGDTTYTYTYDGAGNILTASNGTASHTYTYGDTGWRDLLTAFDGNSITYDAIGNPTSYYNGTRWTFTWANGRNLSTASKSGTSLSFAYDAGGLRTSKTVNGTTYRYFYADSKLMRLTWGSNTVDFFYDANGTPYAMKYNGTLYYYVTNLQGDVMRVVNASGTVVASYDYDPYGKVISATGTMANINPLCYRGYVYDTETGFYYLKSRYYDPEICRFINADNFASTGQGIVGHNMFAYCNNNPVNLNDRGGNWPSLSQALGIVAVSAAVVAVVAAYIVAAPALAGAGGIAAITAAASTSAVVSTAVEVSTAAVVATVVSTVVEKKAEQWTKSYTVYTLLDPNTEEVTYVGRTSSFSTRMAAHGLNPLRKNLIPKVVCENLGYYQARAFEQMLIIHYCTIDKTNKSKNQINGVNPKRKDYVPIMRNGFGISEALDSILTNELLVYFE